MNLKLLKKLCRRFARLRAGEPLDESDALTPQELRHCRHMIERFHCYGDRRSFEQLVAWAIADIYGSTGKLDFAFQDLLRRIRQEAPDEPGCPDKPSLKLVLGLLKTLPTDGKHIETLALLLHAEPTSLPTYQASQQAALHAYARTLGDRGSELLAILEALVKTGVTEGLIGNPPNDEPQYEPQLLLQWACDLESQSAAAALLAARRQDPFLPRLLAALLIELLSSKSYKAACFFLSLDLPCRLQLKGARLSGLLQKLLTKNRVEGLEILVKALAVIDVIPESGATLPKCLLNLAMVKKHGYGQWKACDVLCRKAKIGTANDIPLFESPGEAISLLETMAETRLLQMERFEQCSFADQYRIVKAIIENPEDIHGPAPYERLTQELKSYPALSKIFCKSLFSFEGPSILLRHAARTNDINCLSAIGLDEIGTLLAGYIQSETGSLLNSWPVEENLAIMERGILFSALVHGSLDFLALVEAKAGVKGVSPLQALQAAILQRPARKGWLVFINFLTRCVGKPAIRFLLDRKFLELTDLPPEIQAAVTGEMTPEDYALHFLSGEAAWADCGLPVIHDFMTSRSRSGFNTGAYRQLCILSNAAAAMAGEEIDDETLEQGFKLSALFGTPDRAWAYIEKYAKKGERWPIHRLCQFDLPSGGFWPPEKWGDFALLHGLDGARWVVFAPYFEKAGLGVPQDPTVAQSFVVTGIYGVDNAAPVKLRAFANLCASYRLAPEAFRVCKGHIDAGLKARDNLPPCFISGVTIGVPGYYFMKLPSDDMRGFLLGKITNCCQYVGGIGSSCAINGMTDKNSGFYVLCKMAGNTPSPDDPIVAQLWAWIGEQDYLVFDSWERLRSENDWMCRRFLSSLWDLVQPGPHAAIKGFHLGGGGNSPTALCYQKSTMLDTHPDEDIYSDADTAQLMISGRDPSEKEERDYLRKIAREFDLEETSVYFLFEETIFRNEGWANNIANLLRSQRGVTNVTFTSHSTSGGELLFLMKAEIDDRIYQEMSAK